MDSNEFANSLEHIKDFVPASSAHLTICVGHLSLLPDLLLNLPCSNLYIQRLDFSPTGFQVKSVNRRLKDLTVREDRILRCLSFPLPVLGSAISPKSHLVPQATLSSVLPALGSDYTSSLYSPFASWWEQLSAIANFWVAVPSPL